MKNLWQIAAGEPNRYYEELLFEYGVMILGPSHEGPANIKPFPYKKGKTIDEANQLDLFANTVLAGDRVLLRKKIPGEGSVIIGVGVVRGEYFYEEQFGCIHGWDLCHVWNVDWNRDPDILTGIPNPFSKMKRGPAFSRTLNNVETKIKVGALDESAFFSQRKEIPNALCSQLNLGRDKENIVKALQDKGMDIETSIRVFEVLKHCEEMSKWYRVSQKHNRPTEHEVVSHMILPLLKALGWDFKKIGVEWRRADIALFNSEESKEENCVTIIEAKGLGFALGNVLEQAKTYAKKYSNTKQVIVTDGTNLYLYERDPEGGDFSEIPVGYLNMEYISANYILPRNTSAIDTLVKMLPLK